MIDENKRSVRVFISSTFQDMQEERDILVKTIFPKLRKICMDRGVGFTEVDLRWGVTQEQAERGEVLPICLAEIENCRPFFIGLLGERYGWIPDNIPEALIEEQPWLAEHRHKSVTELEIVHGVLNNPDMAGHAFFYFREPSASPVHSEIPSLQDKQKKLKASIRKSGFSVVENYADAQSVGELVLKDLETAINKEFPEETLSQLERDRLDHEVFADSRAKVYIGREDYFDCLYGHARGTGAPLIVLGESGSGKSALLANWGIEYRKKYPETFMLFHFIGSSTDSTDMTAMLRRVILEIKERYTLENDVPETLEEIRAQFPNWLSMAAARGPFVLILDALNQLEDKDNAAELIWLPEFIPPEVRLIVSTLPGKSLDILRKRNWQTMTVHPLTTEERQDLITDYLFKLYSKTLPPDLVEFIAAQNQCANPLYLHALLEELRIFGKHEEIRVRIDHYLKAKDPGRLYGLILDRLEQDYEKDRPGLVGEAMSLLWAARRGLSEPELLEIMDLPHLSWSQLSLALQDSLVTRSGLLNFFHDYLRQAVYEKYIKISEIEKFLHLRLADYFRPKDVDQRKINELPWQLSQAHEWALLQDCLTDLPFFEAVCKHNEFEALAFWQKIEDNSDLTCTNAYQKVLKSPDQYIDALFPLSELLNARGNLNEALQIRRAQQKYYRAVNDMNRFQAILGNQATILTIQGELDEAMKLFREQEGVCREIGNKKGLQTTLGNQALILADRGKLDEAMILHKEKERICREIDNKKGLQTTLNNQANILYDQGEFDEAMRLYKESELISRELGNKYTLQGTLCNQGIIHHDRGELDLALILYKEQERICRDLGHKAGLSNSFLNQASIHYDQGEFDEAMKLSKESERICRELGDKKVLAASLGNEGTILDDRGEPDKAMRCFKEQELIYRNLGMRHELLNPLRKQANIYFDRGALDEGLKLYKEHEGICRELGNKKELQTTLAQQALINTDQGKLDDAMNLYEEHEQICRELGDKKSLAGSLVNHGIIHYDRGELDRAMILYKESERIYRELDIKKGLLTTLGNQGVVYHDRGEFEEAMKLYKEHEQICREVGDKKRLEVSLENQAPILKAQGELEEAMKLYKEHEQICRELGDKKSLAGSLVNQGLIHYDRGELDEAMKFYRESGRICHEIGDRKGLSVSFGNQGVIYYDQGEFDEAMKLYKDQERICRELDDMYGLSICLINQAEVFRDLEKINEALLLSEESYRVAAEHGLLSLAQQIEPVLDKLRAKLN